MFLRSVLFVFVFAALEAAICAPAGTEQIDPVDLNYFCFQLKQNETNKKSPVLLMHGLTSSSADWEGIYEIIALETGRRVCVVDLRNHGDSPWSDRSDVEAMTVDIEHFLDEKKIQKINLIGHSLGGKIGVHFALKNPDRVDSLVVEDMRPNGVTEEGMKLVQSAIKLFQDAIKTVPDESSEDEAKTVIVKYFIKKFAEFGINETIDESNGNLLAIRLVNGTWQYKMNVDVLAKAAENPEEMLTASTGAYPGPVMFIYGTKSIFDVGGDKMMIREHFRNAKLVPVEGAGHAIHASYSQFKDEVVNFLNNEVD